MNSIFGCRLTALNRKYSGIVDRSEDSEKRSMAVASHRRASSNFSAHDNPFCYPTSTGVGFE